MLYPPRAFQEWFQLSAFRETFLERFPNPQENRSARHFGEMLASMALESGSPRRSDEYYLLSELRAAVADLRYLQRFLAGEGPDMDFEDMDPEQKKAHRLAARWAGRIAGLIDQFEKQLAPLKIPRR